MLRAGMLNFSKGVLSERLLGRIDVAAYNAGLKRGENIVVLKQGAFTIRPGFVVVSEAIGPGERLMPFQFSDEQFYALAFGQQYMQPLTAGGVVLEEELAITGVSNGNPAVISSALHGFAAGDQVFLKGIAGPLGEVLNGRIWTVVAALNPGQFSINLDATALPAFTSAEGGITRTEPPAPPPVTPPTPEPYVPPEPPPVYGGGGYRDRFYREQLYLEQNEVEP